ncbi:MAG: hypothetical protein KIT11_10765 [Fimbriimonadaceae bacterium]|nr:hypothetical protein [Fimbriimonadaceae bacterium]QYK55802.1 MAG: hypothetical protein KF733_12435 [Fimbriimonadaceae bacterium]
MRRALGWLLALTLAGCRPEPAPAPLPKFTPATPPHEVRENSGRAFDEYVLAGEETLKIAPDVARRVSFTSGMRKKVAKDLAAPMARLARAGQLPFEPVARPRTTTEPFEWEIGLRLLGRALAWDAKDAVEHEDWDRAANRVGTAYRLALDLSQVDTPLATLGAAIAHEASATLTPHIGRLPLEVSKKLQSTLATALARQQGTAHLEGDLLSMLAGVDTVREAYETHKTDGLLTTLGRDARPGVLYLQRLAPKDAATYFLGFSNEMQDAAKHWAAQAELPAIDRKPFQPTGERPWRRLARHWQEVPGIGLKTRDLLLARARLFAVALACHLQVEQTGSAPEKLDLPPALVTDPYSKQPFVYLASGPDFRLYSVGEDGRDDGGDTDSLGVRPDVVLDPGL